MQERGIIFQAWGIRAIGDDLKTQTRRIVKGIHPDNLEARIDYSHECPYGQVGDLLYCRETHYRYGKWVKNGKTKKTGKQAWRFVAYNGDVPAFQDVFFSADDVYTVRPNSYRKKGWYKRPSIFMLKKFARHWLKLTDVRVERVQDITFEDVKREGITIPGDSKGTIYLRVSGKYCPSEYYPKGTICKKGVIQKPEAVLVAHFASVWDTINAKRGYGWDVNPWVWALTFERIEHGTG